MDYRKFDDKYLIRLDPDDEILASVTAFAKKENIETGTFTGLGACKVLELGVYDVAEKVFHGETYTGAWEVNTMFGTVTQMNGEPHLHVHLSASTLGGKTVGGHLKKGVISGTAEIMFTPLAGKAGRAVNPLTGLNDIDFE